ncbi:MAG TPA: GNAT family N-acetyltransferase [Anaerolineales bacterium]|nr:GNAT family N-acetyltransferase [Anaerolineales bacterium]
MDENLKLEVVHANQLTSQQLAEIHALCNRAYGKDLGYLFRTFTDTTHVIGQWGSAIVSHAMWVTRWLQPGNQAPLRTAYIEMVATEPQFQHRGFATAVMHQLANAIHDYELGGLCPAEPALYAKLDWVFWQGPLFIRTPDGLLSTPEENIMILLLPKTPPLDLTLPLSAEWREGELW